MNQALSSVTRRTRVRLLFWAIMAIFAIEILFFALI
jgi:hypothetical protein